MEFRLKYENPNNITVIFCKSVHFRISDMKILFFTLFSLFLNETESVVQVERFPQLRYLTIAAGVLL